MALSPILVIGCGGSGGKVVLGLRQRLEAELRRKGWEGGLPDAWQLKWIDVPAVPEAHPDFGPPLPLGDYVGLAPVNSYSAIDGALVNAAGAAHIDRLVGWRPTPNLPLPVAHGAGQMRAVGRSVALANKSKIVSAVESAFAAMSGGQAELGQVCEKLGATKQEATTPAVFVVSSMAGGTGAGIFMDVCDVVRAMRPEVSQKIFGFLFTAEIFQSINGDGGMAPNTVASLVELVNGFTAVNRPVEPLYGALGAVNATGRSGPSLPYVIGMQPLHGGAPLESPAQCYRSVTETMVASIMNEKFQQDFINYEATNFLKAITADKRQTAFRMLNEPLAPGDNNVACGVVSSFGSASVSVGSVKFAEWARDRLARSVVDHVVSGWRDFGRQLMGDKANAAVTDPQIVDYVVGRERQLFIEHCGLWEEDEPNGTQHNQVLDGIASIPELTLVRDSFRAAVLNELNRAGDKSAADWEDLVLAESGRRASTYRGDVAKTIAEGVERFAPTVVTNVSGAVSQWLARYGVAVTKGLVRELRDQCRSAIEQLKAAIARDQVSAQQDPRTFVRGAFQGMRDRDKCSASSAYVGNALGSALGPYAFYAQVARHEAAVDLLDRVIVRVIQPLIQQLDDVGGALASDDATAQVKNWPDNSGAVGPMYRPSPNEKVLLDPLDWDAEYKRLLELSAGSVSGARDQVAAGGFQFGRAVNLVTAPSMISFDTNARWWDRDGLFVDVIVRLRSDEIAERARQWLWNENHAAGKFVRMGLDEYLSEVGEQRKRRLQNFERALTDARNLAQPLVRISNDLMHRLHPGKSDLKTNLVCEPFPFSPAMVEAREIVERVMFQADQPDGGWFASTIDRGSESVLITSILSSAVQPAAVASLTEPIASKWSAIQRQPIAARRDAIRGFWTYNRARLLTECVPLPAPSVQKIIRGWFVGRLLGLVSNASEAESFRVHYELDGVARVAPMPWPLLRHSESPELHLRSHQLEWLPALLEHMGIAMMLIGQQPDSLDGYEHLYQMGERAEALLETWVVEGVVPISGGGTPQVGGATAEERSASALKALGELTERYTSRLDSAKIVAPWNQFVQIPYGYEMLPMIIDALSGLGQQITTIDTPSEFG